MTDEITQTQKDNPDVVVRHTQNAAPTDAVPPPVASGNFILHESVRRGQIRQVLPPTCKLLTHSSSP